MKRRWPQLLVVLAGGLASLATRTSEPYAEATLGPFPADTTTHRIRLRTLSDGDRPRSHAWSQAWITQPYTWDSGSPIDTRDTAPEASLTATIQPEDGFAVALAEGESGPDLLPARCDTVACETVFTLRLDPAPAGATWSLRVGASSPDTFPFDGEDLTAVELELLN